MVAYSQEEVIAEQALLKLISSSHSILWKRESRECAVIMAVGVSRKIYRGGNQCRLCVGGNRRR